jgi:hypothetical protein
MDVFTLRANTPVFCEVQWKELYVQEPEQPKRCMKVDLGLFAGKAVNVKKKVGGITVLEANPKNLYFLPASQAFFSTQLLPEETPKKKLQK